jgi:hypothetical protein
MSRSSAFRLLVVLAPMLLTDVNWSGSNGRSSLVVQAESYTSGATSVDVTIEHLDNYGSSNKCVTYKSGAPDEDWDTACFTSSFTDGLTFQGCTVSFGDGVCNSCEACEDQDENVGFTMDCFNLQPAETTMSCIILNNANIQTVLVDDEFASQPFAFSDNVTRTEEDAPADDKSGVTATASSLAVVSLTMATLILSSILSTVLV